MESVFLEQLQVYQKKYLSRLDAWDTQAYQTWCPVRHDSLGSILDAKTAPRHRGTSILCCDEVVAKPKGMTHLAGEHQPKEFLFAWIFQICKISAVLW